MAAKRRIQKTESSTSALDAKRKALAEEERKLAEEIARRQRLIEEAPKIAREQAKLRREELIARASRTEARFGAHGSLPDPRFSYEANIATVGRGRQLKREQRRGMLTFFVLLLTLAGVVSWLYFTLIRGF